MSARSLQQILWTFAFSGATGSQHFKDMWGLQCMCENGVRDGEAECNSACANEQWMNVENGKKIYKKLFVTHTGNNSNWH